MFPRLILSAVVLFQLQMPLHAYDISSWFKLQTFPTPPQPAAKLDSHVHFIYSSPRQYCPNQGESCFLMAAWHSYLKKKELKLHADVAVQGTSSCKLKTSNSRRTHRSSVSLRANNGAEEAGDYTDPPDPPRYTPLDPPHSQSNSAAPNFPLKPANPSSDSTAEVSKSSTLNLKKNGQNLQKEDVAEVNTTIDEIKIPRKKSRQSRRRRRNKRSEEAAASPEAWRALNEVILLKFYSVLFPRLEFSHGFHSAWIYHNEFMDCNTSLIWFIAQKFALCNVLDSSVSASKSCAMHLLGFLDDVVI